MAAPGSSSLTLEVVTPGGTALREQVDEVVAPGEAGEFGVLPGHLPMLADLKVGLLHFRKGRTNWEYIALLAPSLDWRPDLITLTRRFEQEWYGHDESSIDALTDCSENARSILDAIRGEMRGAA